MTHMLRRVSNAYKGRGLGELCRLIVYNLRYYAKNAVRFSRKDSVEIDEFDRVHGTETGVIREIGSLAIESDNAKHAVRYEPTDADIFPRLLGGLDADLSPFSFVDFGCGKGRILLLASNYPFRKVTGLEFSPELGSIAERNIRIYQSPGQRCKAINVVMCDAAEYVIPDEPLVCYFYNPFGAEVMRKVAANLLVSYRRCRRDMFLIYLNPRHRSVIDASGCWAVVSETPSHAIYRNL